MATIYIICCNDSLEAAHPGPEAKANDKLEELARAHFDKFEKNSRGTRDGVKDYKEYRHLFYWHLHTVTLVE